MITLIFAMTFASSGPLTADELRQLVDEPASEWLDANIGDVDFTMDLTQELRPNTQRHSGKLTWNYVEQLRFSNPGVDIRRDGPARFDPSATTHTLRLTAFDAFGRHWESETSWTPPDASDSAPPQSGTVEWQPHQWIGEDCVDNRGAGLFFGDDHFWWQGFSQVPADEDGTQPWEANSVLIDNRRSESLCSGSLVSVSGRSEPKWALTSAHCIEAGGLGRFAFAEDIFVLPEWADEPYRVATIIIPSSYSSWPGTDFRSDIALLQLVPKSHPKEQAGPWEPVITPGQPTYRLATSETVAPGDAARMVSWPHYVEECDVPPWRPYSNTSDEFGKQRRRHVQLRVDGGPGQSGSPVELCEGDCTERLPGKIMAVYSGWNSVSKTHVGPWVPFYAQAFEGVME